MSSAPVTLISAAALMGRASDRAMSATSGLPA
jgi:hypothetical protein